MVAEISGNKEFSREISGNKDSIVFYLRNLAEGEKIFRIRTSKSSILLRKSSKLDLKPPKFSCAFGANPHITRGGINLARGNKPKGLC